MNIDYSWRHYQTKMDEAIDALKVTMKRKTGKDLTSEECWQFLAWCGDILIQHIFSSVPHEQYNTIMDLMEWVSGRCSDNYRATITGNWDPPGTRWYASPEAFEAAKQQFQMGFGGNIQHNPPPTAGGQVIEDHHRGYL